MGTCSTKESSSYRKVSRSGQPSLIFSVKTWPLNHSINFRDESSCLSFNYSLVMNDGDKQEWKFGSPNIQQKFSTLPYQPIQKSLSCSIERKNNIFSIKFAKEVYRSAVGWLPINLDDVCLIGKTKYRLWQFIRQQFKKEEILEKVLDNEGSQVSEGKGSKCRICYSSHSTNQNPLLSPCECRGSIQFIHLDCLGNWLFGSVRQEDFLFLQTRKSQCEICKTNITETDAYKRIVGRMFAGYHHITPPFAAFEGQLPIKQEKSQKCYMILSFAQKEEFKIGRSHLADIMDKADPFVSRINSIIAYRNNQLWIKDNQSKHGTGIRLKKPLMLSSDNPHESIIHYNSNINIDYVEN